jgi:Flp pilus assembly protein CpaB
MRGKSTLLSLVALFSGLATSIGISRVFEGPPEKPVKITQETILVAAADIDIGEPFSSENVKVLRCPCNRISDDCLRRFQDLESSVATRRLQADEPIVDSHLQRPVAKREPVPSPAGRSVQLVATVDSALLDSIQEGDQVQLTCVHPSGTGDPESRIVLRSVRLESLEGRRSGQDAADGSHQVSLRVPEAEVALLLLARELGELHLSSCDESASSEPLDQMASTVADLVALARTGQKSVATPAPLPVDPVTPVKPVIDTPPTLPAITPPVVRDIQTLGQTRPPSSRRDTPGPVDGPARAATSTPSVPARPNARLTLTDEAGQVTREANAGSGSRDLRE